MTPFEALYGTKPPTHSALVDQEPKNVSVSSFLKLQSYRQVSVGRRENQKLSPRFFGPFEIVAKVGRVAYKLNLPEGSQIHPVFHVSQLKRKVGEQTLVSSNLPRHLEKGAEKTMPKAILERRMKRKKNRAGVEWLIWWQGLGVEEATWEDAETIKSQFPHFMNNEDS